MTGRTRLQRAPLAPVHTTPEVGDAMSESYRKLALLTRATVVAPPTGFQGSKGHSATAAWRSASQARRRGCHRARAQRPLQRVPTGCCASMWSEVSGSHTIYVYTESWNDARPISTIAERMYLGVQRDERDGWSDAPRLRHGLTESRSRQRDPHASISTLGRRRDRPDTRGTDTRSRTTERASVMLIPPLIQ